MDERFAIEGEPEEVLSALLGVDPEGNCEHCGHPMTAHQATFKLRREGRACQVDGCGCEFRLPRK